MYVSVFVCYLILLASLYGKLSAEAWCSLFQLQIQMETNKKKSRDLCVNLHEETKVAHTKQERRQLPMMGGAKNGRREVKKSHKSLSSPKSHTLLHAKTLKYEQKSVCLSDRMASWTHVNTHTDRMHVGMLGVCVKTHAYLHLHIQKPGNTCLKCLWNVWLFVCWCMFLLYGRMVGDAISYM